MLDGGSRWTTSKVARKTTQPVAAQRRANRTASKRSVPLSGTESPTGSLATFTPGSLLAVPFNLTRRGAFVAHRSVVKKYNTYFHIPYSLGSLSQVALAHQLEDLPNILRSRSFYKKRTRGSLRYHREKIRRTAACDKACRKFHPLPTAHWTNK